MPVTLHFTKDEVNVMDSRFSVPECIAEALTDHDPEQDAVPPYTYDEVYAAADKIGKELLAYGRMTFESQVERDAIADAIDGSTFGDFIADAVQDGDMTNAEAAKWRRVMRSITTKLKPHGITVDFPAS